MAYEQSLAISQKIGDLKGKAITQGQLGSLFLLQGKLAEAEQRCKNAVLEFQQLNRLVRK